MDCWGRQSDGSDREKREDSREIHLARLIVELLEYSVVVSCVRIRNWNGFI